MSAADLLNAEHNPTPTHVETVLQSRVEEAKTLLDMYDALSAESVGYEEATQQAHFLRGVVAGINYSIRRVREQEASNG